jgi:RNA polymerase sigma factor (sigma-70 family)
MHDEALLLASIRAGSENAFTVVVERYQGRIARYLRRLVGDKAVAEDLTQETFLSAYSAIRKTNSELALGPWLYKIATNHANMHFRRQKLRRFLPFLTDHPRYGTAPPADSGLDEQDHVRRALAKVPPDYAVCLLLHMVEGFKHHEVGAILGISAEAARKRVARGSDMFRRAYAAQEVTPHDLP